MCVGYSTLPFSKNGLVWDSLSTSRPKTESVSYDRISLSSRCIFAISYSFWYQILKLLVGSSTTLVGDGTGISFVILKSSRTGCY